MQGEKTKTGKRIVKAAGKKPSKGKGTIKSEKEQSRRRETLRGKETINWERNHQGEKPPMGKKPIKGSEKGTIKGERNRQKGNGPSKKERTLLQFLKKWQVSNLNVSKHD